MGALTALRSRTASYTDAGQRRQLNEDALIEIADEGLWAVADGMGGHSQGDYASRHVCASLAGFRASGFPGVALVRIDTALRACNDHLAARARDSGVDAIGCTVAVLSVHRHMVLCSWSGDARIYRARHGQLRQLTRDHTQRTLAEDDDLMLERQTPLPVSGVLTHAIGGHDDLFVEHCCYELLSGDRYLLCTDGLYKELDEQQLLACLTGDDEPPIIVADLAARYHEGGARDNVGLVYVVVDGMETSAAGGSPSLTDRFTSAAET